LTKPACVRALTLDDLPRCETLSRSIGWPWEAAKWRLLLSGGSGFAVDAPDGSLAGTVVLNRFADAAASIGMLGVAPHWQRQGRGRALMERALELAGSVPIFLYATEQGRRLYAKLGFRVAGGSFRLIGQRTGRPVLPDLGPRRLRRMRTEDLEGVAALDAIAFGAPRPAHLEALLGLADEARVAEEGERLVGYGLAWSVGARRTVGPIVAPDAALAMALLAQLTECEGKTLRIDIPTEFPELAAWARALGLRPDSPAPLMVRNAERAPGRREWLCALAMPGLG
jgi:ribosomal protein S18 acetylase RimI-like enzyme